MANYTGTKWVTKTQISTDILSKIDEGLGQVVDDVKDLNADLTDIVGAKYFTSLDRLVAFADSLKQYQIAFVYIDNTTMGALGGTGGVSKGLLCKSNTSSGTFDFIFEITSGQYIYTGRYDNGTITIYRLGGTNISPTSVGEPVVMGEDD